MKTKTFQIQFDYPVTRAIKLHLQSEVELHHSEPYYIIRNITNINGQKNVSVLFDIRIKAIKGKFGKTRWVHIDSEQESALSKIIGDKISAGHEVEFADVFTDE
ncbi:hypothetical protein FRZ67_18240 [Panacibacter ginsenosidivorans]|uniref:Uncharacterized protein n=1 Tax=Panacibacter ginsenosidivorans TaxID=1813871 RepID=A0A5B8VCA6_9BACT|nr:hypothetical protein [Panacibacter ginsenosidivorans]QEC69157.1 hypothetical protein FRZ67_18240 [Panacibacter ginsenosidivorans]